MQTITEMCFCIALLLNAAVNDCHESQYTRTLATCLQHTKYANFKNFADMKYSDMTCNQMT